MKEQYQNAEMEVIAFNAADVIATSDVADRTPSETWSRRPNETDPDMNTGW